MANSNELWIASLSRRTFLERMGMVCAAGGAAGLAGSGLMEPGLAWGDDNSGPVDCGPPPAGQAQHQTGGESFPPLPLPATPLRPLGEETPARPAGPGRQDGHGFPPLDYQGRQADHVRDWLTDPADMNTLLTWTNQKLGINYRATEADFEHFSFDPRELPALLFAGHNKFTLPDEVRRKLDRYVLDGGMILGDACCGWKDFADSFRKEMEIIFPGRPLRKMLPEEPVYSAYYKLGALNYKKADGSTYYDEPCLESIDFGCRSGVVFSPCDLTCGWDGHEHPRGLRIVIDQARQLGANLITYLLGSFQLARFLSTTKVYYEADGPQPRRFRLRPVDARGGLGPRSVGHSQPVEVRPGQLDAEVKFKRQNVRLKDPKTTSYPLLYMTGHREFVWSTTRWGAAKVPQGRRPAVGRLLLRPRGLRHGLPPRDGQGLSRPEAEKLPPDHPLLHCHHDIRTVDYTPRVREDFGPLDSPELEGITVDNRLVVIYSKFDLGNGWEQFPHAYSYGLKDESALQIGTNVLVYATTHGSVV